MYKFSKEFLDGVRKPIPDALIKQKPGVKTQNNPSGTLDYISGATVVDYLNIYFNYMWSFEIVKLWKEASEPKMPNKYELAKGQKEAVPQGPVAHVLIKLTAYVQDDKTGNLLPIVKMADGSQAIIGPQNVQEYIYKAAQTDGLKKAASLFGIGLPLYRDDNEEQYFGFHDEWNETNIAEYAPQLQHISDVENTHDLTDDDMNGLVHEFSKGLLNDTSQIVPSNIDDFIAYLDSTLNIPQK